MIEKKPKRIGVKIGIAVTIVCAVIGIVFGIAALSGIARIGDISGTFDSVLHGTDIDFVFGSFALLCAIAMCALGFIVPVGICLVPAIIYWIVYGIFRYVQKSGNDMDRRDAV